jgi:CRISPR-associated endoribonuclease Cas6
MTPELTIAEYVFSFEAIDTVTLFAFPDPLWRSVFGLALYEQTCIAPKSECRECMLRFQCDFAFFIKGPRPPHAEIMRKIDTIPLPHIIHCPQTGQTTTSAGERFTINLVLVGTGCERLPSVIRAMARAGLMGFGRQRQKGQLVAVSQTSPNLLPRLIMDQQTIVAPSIVEQPEIPSVPAAIRLEFLTPYLPSDKSFSPNRINITHLLMAIVRKVSLLQYFYTGKRLEADFKKLKEQAVETNIIGVDLHRRKGSYYSARQNRRINYYGLKGSIDFSLENIEDFWNYLYLVQWLHVGKQASKGFGHYRLLEK